MRAWREAPALKALRIAVLAALVLAPAQASSPQPPASGKKETPPPVDGWRLTADGSASEALARGLALFEKYELDAALAAYEEALAGFQAAGDRAGEAAALHSIGRWHYWMSDYPEALSFYHRALALRESLGDLSGTGMTLNFIGVAHASIGDYVQALAFYERSLRAFLDAGDKAGIARTLNSMGASYDYLGDIPRALSLYGRSIALKENLGDRHGVGWTLNNIGNLHYYEGDCRKSLPYYERSLALDEEFGDKRGAARVLNNMGDTYLCLGDRAKARPLYERALALWEELRDREGLTMTLSNLCGAGFGSMEETFPRCVRALALAETIGATGHVYGARTAFGKAFAASGDREAAAAHFRAAIETVEGMRALISESVHKAGYLGMRLEAYESLVELLVESWPLTVDRSEKTDNDQPSTGNSANEAFAVAERMKARSFLDELGAARATREGAPKELMEEKRQLEARIRWIRERAE